MSKDPAFLLYDKDFLEGTADMTLAEIGMYIILLCHQHQRGTLPGDIDRLSRLCKLTDNEEKANEKFKDLWLRVQKKFKKLPDGTYYNERLTEWMTERSAAAHKNAVIGHYAKLLRQSSIPLKLKEKIKKEFNLSDFIAGETNACTDRLTVWFTERSTKGVANAHAHANENNNTNGINKGGMGGFVKPTVQEVKSEMLHQGCPELYVESEAAKFVAHHTTCGWKLRGGKGTLMKDWKAAVTTWLHNFYEFKNITPAKQARTHSNPGQL